MSILYTTSYYTARHCSIAVNNARCGRPQPGGSHMRSCEQYRTSERR